MYLPKPCDCIQLYAYFRESATSFSTIGTAVRRITYTINAALISGSASLSVFEIPNLLSMVLLNLSRDNILVQRVSKNFEPPIAISTSLQRRLFFFSCSSYRTEYKIEDPMFQITHPPFDATKDFFLDPSVHLIAPDGSKGETNPFLSLIWPHAQPQTFPCGQYLERPLIRLCSVQRPRESINFLAYRRLHCSNTRLALVKRVTKMMQFRTSGRAGGKCCPASWLYIRLDLVNHSMLEV